MTRRLSSSWAVALVVLACACGGASQLPRRGVLEHDVKSWGFRRYQAVLDPEVWVKNNRATGYTASYVRKKAEKRGHLGEGDVANVFVTRFAHDGDLVPALVRFARRLAQESGYVVDEDDISGTHLLVVKGHGEQWAWWSSHRALIKVGGRGVSRVPAALVDAYSDLYPSNLPGGALDMDLEEIKAPEPKTQDYNPDNPTPDWRHEQDGGKHRSKHRSKKHSR